MSENTSLNVRKLLAHIETFASSELAEEWDNIGLMAGDYNAEVKRVGICLDAVSEAVIEADNHGCEVLLCHHPLIFRPLKNICVNYYQGRTIYEAVKRNVNIIAAHTNWDKAEEGVNAALSSLLGLVKAKPFNATAFGFHGVMPESMNLKDFLEHVKISWGLSRLDIYANSLPESISRVSLCGGSGAEFWKLAVNRRADIYITADMKYHELIDATRAGLVIALADHGEMERASLPKLAEKISECGAETVILNVKALSSPLRI
ncbi:MAG: Nif3-like dinuclear metal center hexameric protein [Synergistaceae bacterium]|nr:Nif3-like dinuclear metal center hexameric protein [Synergistaceae bacterium]